MVSCLSFLFFSLSAAFSFFSFVLSSAFFLYSSFRLLAFFLLLTPCPFPVSADPSSPGLGHGSDFTAWGMSASLAESSSILPNFLLGSPSFLSCLPDVGGFLLTLLSCFRPSFEIPISLSSHSSHSSSVSHLPHKIGSAPFLLTFSFTHSFTFRFVPFSLGFPSRISCGSFFNHLLALVLHDFLFHWFIFLSSSSDTVLILITPFLSTFAILSIRSCILPLLMTFSALKIVAFAAVWPISSHPSLSSDLVILKARFPSPPIHSIAWFCTRWSASRSTFLPMLVTSRCWCSLLMTTPSTNFFLWSSLTTPSSFFKDLILNLHFLTVSFTWSVQFMFSEIISPRDLFFSSAAIFLPASVIAMSPPFSISFFRAFLSPKIMSPVLSSFTFTRFSLRLLKRGLSALSSFLSNSGHSSPETRAVVSSAYKMHWFPPFLAPPA